MTLRAMSDISQRSKTAFLFAVGPLKCVTDQQVGRGIIGSTGLQHRYVSGQALVPDECANAFLLSHADGTKHSGKSSSMPLNYHFP